MYVHVCMKMRKNENEGMINMFYVQARGLQGSETPHLDNMMGPFEPWCPKSFPTSSLSQLVDCSRSARHDWHDYKGRVPMHLLLE